MPISRLKTKVHLSEYDKAVRARAARQRALDSLPGGGSPSFALPDDPPPLGLHDHIIYNKSKWKHGTLSASGTPEMKEVFMARIQRVAPSRAHFISLKDAAALLECTPETLLRGFASVGIAVPVLTGYRSERRVYQSMLVNFLSARGFPQDEIARVVEAAYGIKQDGRTP